MAVIDSALRTRLEGAGFALSVSKIEVVGPSLEERILEYVTSAGPAGRQRSDLVVKFKHKSAEFKLAFDRLREDGRINFTMVKTSGRPGEIITLAD